MKPLPGGGGALFSGSGVFTSPKSSRSTELAAGGPRPLKAQNGVSRQPGAPAARSRARSTNAEQPQQLRVAVLTPEVKLDVVRAVRRRLGNESCWLAGLKQGMEVRRRLDQLEHTRSGQTQAK